MNSTNVISLDAYRAARAHGVDEFTRGVINTAIAKGPAAPTVVGSLGEAIGGLLFGQLVGRMLGTLLMLGRPVDHPRPAGAIL